MWRMEERDVGKGGRRGGEMRKGVRGGGGGGRCGECGER